MDSSCSYAFCVKVSLFIQSPWKIIDVDGLSKLTLHPELADAPLRRHLVKGDPEISDGTFPLPEGPGLGISLNEEYLAELGGRWLR